MCIAIIVKEVFTWKHWLTVWHLKCHSGWYSFVYTSRQRKFVRLSFLHLDFMMFVFLMAVYRTDSSTWDSG